MFQTTNQRVSTELDGLQLTGSPKVGACWGRWGHLGPLRRQAKSARQWTQQNGRTGKPANRHKLQKNRTFVVQLCCPKSQTLHVPFKRRHVSKCLGAWAAVNDNFIHGYFGSLGLADLLYILGSLTVLFGITYGLPYCINSVDVEYISWVRLNIKKNCIQLSNNTDKRTLCIHHAYIAIANIDTLW